MGGEEGGKRGRSVGIVSGEQRDKQKVAWCNVKSREVGGARCGCSM